MRGTEKTSSRSNCYKSLLTFMLLVTLVVSYLVMLGVYRVRRNSDVTQLGYDLDRVWVEQQHLHQEQKRLVIEATKLTEPGLLRRLAKDGNTLDLPGSGEVRRLTCSSMEPPASGGQGGEHAQSIR